MFCPMCGKKITNPRSRFCSQCGAPLTEYLEFENTPPVDPVNAASPKKEVSDTGCTETELYTDDDGDEAATHAESPLSTGMSDDGQESALVGRTKKFNVKVFVITIGVVLSLAVSAAALLLTGSLSSISVRYSIEAGSKYLLEMNYEQAIIEFNKALDVDSQNVEAILGIARAYHDMGNINKAIEALQKGYQETGNERIWELLNNYKGELGNTNPVTPADPSSENAVTTSSGTVTSSIPSVTTQTSTTQTSAEPNEPQAAESGVVYTDISDYFDQSDELKALGDGVIANCADNNSFPDVYSIDENKHFKEITSGQYNFNGVYGYNTVYGTFDSPEGDIDKYHIVKATADGLKVIKESSYPMAVSDDGYIIYFSDKKGKSVTINMQSPEGKLISSKKVTANQDAESPTMIYVGFGVYLSRIRESFVNSQCAYYEMDNGTGNYVFGKDGSVRTVLNGSDRVSELFPGKITISGVEYHYQDCTYFYDNVVLEYNEASQEMMYFDKVESKYCMYALGNLSSGKMSQFYKEIKYAGNGFIRFVGRSGKTGYMDTNGEILIKGCNDVGAYMGNYSFICQKGIYYLVNRNLERLQVIDGTNVKSIGNDMFTCIRHGKLCLVTVN